MAAHPANSPRVGVSDSTHGLYRVGDGSFSFAAAHFLNAAAARDGRAARPHGHTFTVEVELTDTELRVPGFVADYAELAPVGEYLKRELDHRDLNALFSFDTTTDALAEHLTSWFLTHMAPELRKQLHTVRVCLGATPTSVGRLTDEVSFRFEAAHRLEGLPEGHKCARLHGHSYRVDLTFASGTSPRHRERLGALLAGYIDRCLDYRDLNTVLPVQPTSELLAKHLHTWIRDHARTEDRTVVRAVRVWESPRRWAEFTSAERNDP